MVSIISLVPAILLMVFQVAFAAESSSRLRDLSKGQRIDEAKEKKHKEELFRLAKEKTEEQRQRWIEPEVAAWKQKVKEENALIKRVLRREMLEENFPLFVKVKNFCGNEVKKEVKSIDFGEPRPQWRTYIEPEEYEQVLKAYRDIATKTKSIYDENMINRLGNREMAIAFLSDDYDCRYHRHALNHLKNMLKREQAAARMKDKTSSESV